MISILLSRDKQLFKLTKLVREYSTKLEHLSLTSKKVLITGGSSGIGYAIAHRFATEGASCFILGRSFERSEKASSKLPILSSSMQSHGAIQLDVSTVLRPWTEVDLGLDPAAIDIVVNAAGITQSKLLCLMNSEEIDRIIRTNLLGTIYSCRTFARAMMRSKSDKSIINISSILSAQAGRGSVVYSASKAGIEGLTTALALELGSKHVRVNAIQPGLIQTDMLDEHVSKSARQEFINRVPARREGLPGEVAHAALFLATNRYINGSILNVDGGFSIS
ncbi:NAD(P)-binding protein [Lipomyces oligophaga]|uniref:NAD(P)-binding protein n=1 Tax=Lipomyces oligophaga TaxID=45792 RepID=UPI0034CFF33D